MNNKTIKRLIATALAFTMMWGMSITGLAFSASYGNANCCNDAIQEAGAVMEESKGITNITWVDDVSALENANSYPEGYVGVSGKANARAAAVNAFFQNYDAKHGGDLGGGDAWGECGCQELYDAWVTAEEDWRNHVTWSDGSKYVEEGNGGSCEDVVVSESKSNDVVDKTEEVVIAKTPENDFNTFMDASKKDVSVALNALNQAIASGDTQKAQNIREAGVTVDTGVWYSFNLGVYEQIENAGIPVTLKFRYKGVRYSVTIPAGAKVTELCDEKGWCGFLNLAAHYGFEVL